MRKIAIVNNKGGVGKTTSAHNLAHYFARSGLKTLLIDMDPQGNLSFANGFSSNKVDIQIKEILETKKIIASKINENLFLIPSNLQLENCNVSLISDAFYVFNLRKILSAYENEYDICVMDSSPALSPLTRITLGAADSIYIPIVAGIFEVIGSNVLMNHIKSYQELISVQVKGIFITKYENRTSFSRDIINELKKMFGESILLNTKIRKNVSIEESFASQMNIFDYKINSNGAEDYANLAEEILAIEGITKKKSA